MVKRTKSIFFRLTLLFIILGILPLLAAGIILFYQFRNNMEDIMLSDMKRMVSYGGQNAEKVIEECNSLTKRIYDVSTEDGRFLYQILKDESLSESEKRLQVLGLLNDLLNSDSRARSVYFYSKQKEMFVSTRNTQKNLNQEEFVSWIHSVQKQDKRENFAALPTHRDNYFPGSENQVITFYRPYQDTSSFQTIDEQLGVLYVDMDISRLSVVLQDLRLGMEESFQIVDYEGRCIYSTDTGQIGAQAEALLPFFPHMNEDQGSILKNGIYGVYDRIESCGWVVTALAGRNSILTHLDQTRDMVAMVLAAAFVLLVCLYSHFYKKIRRPVERLEEGMQQIQNGHLDTRIDLGNREDEIGVLASGLNEMAGELENYIKRVYIAEIRQRDAELDALKSQIKPHYLYNTLEVIRMTALEHEDGETARMVESLSKQLRYLMGYNSDRVPLWREIDNIREYFYIMNIRFENRLHLEISVDEDVKEASIIKLSLQPVVENAVRHGLRPKDGHGTVRIEAHSQNGTLELVVMDDGVGMDEAALEALNRSLIQREMGERTEDGWKHVGIKNVCDRIKKNYGEEYGLEIISEKEIGTFVTFHLPLIL